MNPASGEPHYLPAAAPTETSAEPHYLPTAAPTERSAVAPPAPAECPPIYPPTSTPAPPPLISSQPGPPQYPVSPYAYPPPPWQYQYYPPPYPPSFEEQNYEWLKSSRSTLLVVVTLITTISFQLSVNPPGGLWQDDGNEAGHVAGRPIMASKDPWRYSAFNGFNSLCFYFSLFLTVWLLSGASLKSRLFTFCFLSCIATLWLLFYVSQLGAEVKWCFITWGFLIVFSAVLSCKNRKVGKRAGESTGVAGLERGESMATDPGDPPA